jgi:hypothetical protein
MVSNPTIKIVGYFMNLKNIFYYPTVSTVGYCTNSVFITVSTVLGYYFEIFGLEYFNIN